MKEEILLPIEFTNKLREYMEEKHEKFWLLVWFDNFVTRVLDKVFDDKELLERFVKEIIKEGSYDVRMKEFDDTKQENVKEESKE